MNGIEVFFLDLSYYEYKNILFYYDILMIVLLLGNRKVLFLLCIILWDFCCMLLDYK